MAVTVAPRGEMVLACCGRGLIRAPRLRHTPDKQAGKFRIPGLQSWMLTVTKPPAPCSSTSSNSGSLVDLVADLLGEVGSLCNGVVLAEL